MRTWRLSGLSGLFGFLLLASLAVGCPSSPTGKLTLDGFLEGDLPSGFETAGGEGGFQLCEPCALDEDCQDGDCIPLASGNSCLNRCDSGICPSGYICTEEERGPYCVPLSGTCGCTESEAGEQKPCAYANEFGQCPGTATCVPEKGWLCGAAQAKSEICDYEDNDCDDEVDEDFKIGEWYFGPNHCGECDFSCQEAIENGTGYCSLSPPPAHCKVESCAPGYYSPDELVCIPAEAMACVPCATDSDCVGGFCFSLDDGLYCLPECGETCPVGYECNEGLFEGGLCLPSTGSCICNESSVGLEKTCSVSNEHGTCFGYQLCTDAGWSACEAPLPAPEDCNGKDDDCDGLVDENLFKTEPCYNQVPGIGTCAGMVSCQGEEGWLCDALVPEPEKCDYLDNNCDGVVDEGYRDPETGLYTLDTDCGVCGNSCLSVPMPHATGYCKVMDSYALCEVTCQNGWVDLNELEEDGCECQIISTDDPPDGVDQNCDGIDGDPDNAVFVSPLGSDSNPGTLEEPVRHINQGLKRAVEFFKGHVYVAEGPYAEAVLLVDGKQVFGGFVLDFSVRDADLYVTVLEGTPVPAADVVQAALSGYSVGKTIDKTLFDGFTIIAPYVDLPGRSSFSVHLLNCGANLYITNNEILAGAGGDGTNGMPGKYGMDGASAGNGLGAKDAGPNKCNSSLPGGKGGVSQCDSGDTSGGAGGTSTCPDYNQFAPGDDCDVGPDQVPEPFEHGNKGHPLNKGGKGGYPGYDALISIAIGQLSCEDNYANCFLCHVSYDMLEGSMGDPGKHGNHGKAGEGCDNPWGGIAGVEWGALPGSTGGSGTSGGGGGGGGAGGGVETWGCKLPGPDGLPSQKPNGSDLGGSGGGGGAGGCPATGGTGGTSGGGSFGVFLLWTEEAAGYPQVADNIIETGLGGVGGTGGDGGVGGHGGWGGYAGASGASNEATWCAGPGGAGGNGGNGGSGAGGGGGCGGVAVGLYLDLDHFTTPYLNDIKKFFKENNTVKMSSGGGGPGGSGGSSKGKSGLDGDLGLHMKFNY